MQCAGSMYYMFCMVSVSVFIVLGDGGCACPNVFAFVSKHRSEWVCVFFFKYYTSLMATKVRLFARAAAARIAEPRITQNAHFTHIYSSYTHRHKLLVPSAPSPI